MSSTEREAPTNDLEEINRRLSILERRMAKQEKSHGLLVAILTLALILIVAAFLFLFI